MARPRAARSGDASLTGRNTSVFAAGGQASSVPREHRAPARNCSPWNTSEERPFRRYADSARIPLRAGLLGHEYLHASTFGRGHRRGRRQAKLQESRCRPAPHRVRRLAHHQAAADAQERRPALGGDRRTGEATGGDEIEVSPKCRSAAGGLGATRGGPRLAPGVRARRRPRAGSRCAARRRRATPSERRASAARAPGRARRRRCPGRALVVGLAPPLGRTPWHGRCAPRPAPGRASPGLGPRSALPPAGRGRAPMPLAERPAWRASRRSRRPVPPRPVRRPGSGSSTTRRRGSSPSDTVLTPSMSFAVS